MLNNFIAAKLHKRKCYKRIKPKAIKQAYLGLFFSFELKSLSLSLNTSGFWRDEEDILMEI